MHYTQQEVMQFVEEENVKFIRLAFCDIFGKQKNISIMPNELNRAFEYGISIDAWSISGFDTHLHSDLFLHPDPATLVILPWRPEHGRVVRMFCDITYSDGTPFECDTRLLLKQAINVAASKGYTFQFGSEMEFYLFNRDDLGNPTSTPYDEASYMDIAPDDKGENIRREICLTLEQMGIMPQRSHHEEGPGQNEVDFCHSDPLTAADHAITFASVVRTVANRNGLYADFGPKPIHNAPGNGMHINFSVRPISQSTTNPMWGNTDSKAPENVAHSLTTDSQKVCFYSAISGILNYITDMALFLNPVEDSYKRLGIHKAPKYISWAKENRSVLIRIPATTLPYKRAELRSPDAALNPYVAYSLLIYAALEGIEKNIELPPPADINFYTAPLEVTKNYQRLPEALSMAKELAQNSTFIHKFLPESIITSYCQR